MRRPYVLYAAFFIGTLAMAQTPLIQGPQRTTGVVSVTSGQTARLNILYPIVPAPLFPVLCGANMAIADEGGGLLASRSVDQLSTNRSVSLDFNVDSTPHAGAIKIHGFSVSSGCHLLTTLEVIDNATQKTVLVVPSETTFALAGAMAAQ